jgi:hypothetical protein
MWWVRHAARMRRMINAYETQSGNLKGRDLLLHIDVGGRIIHNAY